MGEEENTYTKPPEKNDPGTWERLGPLQDRKTQQPLNSPKIHQKYQKIRFSVFWGYFCPILLVGAFSYSVGSQVFRNPGQSQEMFV